LGEKGENDFKVVQINLERIGEKNFKKKKREQALLGRPASLSAQPAARPASPSPLSPVRGARLAPSSDGHVAAVRRRWARRGRPPPPPWSGRRPAPPDHSLHSVARASPSSLRPRSSSSSRSSAARHYRSKPRRSPPAAPELQARRQEYQRTCRRRGKPLRALYRGEKQPCAVNRSPVLLRPRRSAPPRWILLYPASFRSFFGALGR
jgi:hypothetical protein